MEDYIENILAENLTLKRKLDSKCEAITILNGEVDKLKSEKEYMKKSIEEFKFKQLPSCSEPEVVQSDNSRVLRSEIETLRQKLRDALGDVKALRSQLSQEKHVCAGCDENRDFFKEEKLVEQLEEVQRSKKQLEADLQAILDEKEELVMERDAYKCKLHRLNHECNVLLKGNTNGIIDLDALVMENRLLQERLLQAQEKCQLQKQVSERYKSMLQTRKHEGASNICNGYNHLGMFLSQKQVKKLLENCGSTDLLGLEASSIELRSLCLALLDNVGDKTLALSHQKRANRILAARIAELQARLEITHTKRAVESPSTALLEGYTSIEPLSSTREWLSSEHSLHSCTSNSDSAVQ